MNVNGLTAGQALSIITESGTPVANISKTTKNPIDQLKRRNNNIVASLGLVTAIALIAYSIFTVGFLLVTASSAWTVLAIVIVGTFGIVPIGQGIMAIAVLVMLPINALLDRITVRPYKNMKNEIEFLYPTQDDRDQSLIQMDDLLMLMEKCDMNVRALFVEKMNFDQLKNTESILSKKNFKNLIIPNVNLKAHENWRLILDFEDLKSEKRMDAIVKRGVFRDALENTEVLDTVRHRICKKNDPNKLQLIKALDDIAGLNDSEQETVKLRFSDGHDVIYPINWITQKSEIVKKCIEGSGASVIEVEDKHSNLIQCFDILKGMSQLPNDPQSLDGLANTADYYGLDDLTEMIGTKMIKRFRTGKLSKIDLISWFAKKIPNKPMFASLRKRAILLTGLSKIESLDHFKKLWPLVKGWNEIHEKCISYFKNVLNTAASFRLAYELAIELQSERLKEICMNHLASQDNKYKLAVKACYGIHMPEEVYDLVK